MWHHVKMKLPGGFPDHPHRGIETWTYVIGGEISHEDCTGVTGTLKPGTVEITTAGKGIIHSEIPKSFDEWTEGT